MTEGIELMTTSKPGTVVDAMMQTNWLGRSGNKRNVLAGIVTVNNVTATIDTPVTVGDVVRVGKHEIFVVA